MDENDNIINPLLLKVAQIGDDAVYDASTGTIIFNNNTYNRTSSIVKQNVKFVNLNMFYIIFIVKFYYIILYY